MAAIRSSGNKDTELKLVSIFREHGIKGWRRHPNLPGKPDFIFRPQRLAVFVDGCFWHGCRFHCRIPKTRTPFWTAKINRNKARDKAVRLLLKKRGWRLLRIWEHSLRKPEAVAAKVQAGLATRPAHPTRADLVKPARVSKPPGRPIRRRPAATVGKVGFA